MSLLLISDVSTCQRQRQLSMRTGPIDPVVGANTINVIATFMRLRITEP